MEESRINTIACDDEDSSLISAKFNSIKDEPDVPLTNKMRTPTVLNESVDDEANYQSS